jgi:hypothetical protein
MKYLAGTWSTSGEEPAQFSDLEVVFTNVISTILGLAGIVLFIMLLLGGFRYLTAGGDPKSAEAARKTLTYAIGGLVAIALAYLLLVFIEEFTGINVTVFEIIPKKTLIKPVR